MRYSVLVLAIAATLAVGCSKHAAERPAPIAERASATTTVPTVKTADNPLLAKWEGPYGGVPPFDKMQVSQLKPAIETAIKSHLAELDVIANSTEPATFENTLVAMERTGEQIQRAHAVGRRRSGR